jgi:hypothetical protein
MALIVRIVVIGAALLVASAVAAFVMAFAVVMDWQDVVSVTGLAPGWLAVDFFGLIVSAKGLFSALLLIVLTEALRVRSPLFYAAAGGLGLVALYYGLGLVERGPGAGALTGRELEIMAGAGIAAGFVYWAIAGRKAGAWREQSTSISP